MTRTKPGSWPVDFYLKNDDTVCNKVLSFGAVLKKWQDRVSDLFNQISAGRGRWGAFLFSQFLAAQAAVGIVNVCIGVLQDSQQHLFIGGIGLIMFLLMVWVWLRMHGGD